MRKAGLALTILGVSAFAALLVWGLSLGTASADDATATPTATPEATATPEGTATAEATATPGETCAPVIPGTYNGTVTVNGVPAPDGTTVTATIDGVPWATDTTSGGRYVFDVPASLPTIPPCFAGGDITFTCDSATATDTATWNSGLHDLNLTCGAAATATPTATVPPVTATVTATATAVASPTALPPTGMGSGVGGGGFLWWPLALAAAALTAVAGLYTARRATR
jgi:hypothetical protein